jgi:hypothetical protein
VPRSVREGKENEPQRHREHREKKHREKDILFFSVFLLSVLSVPLWFVSSFLFKKTESPLAGAAQY